jgi:hypothetical protein
MTDRFKGCTVSFERDIRDDDVEPLLDAIRMLRGVAGVTGVMNEHSDWMARTRVRSELSSALFDAINSVLNPRKEQT